MTMELSLRPRRSREEPRRSISDTFPGIWITIVLVVTLVLGVFAIPHYRFGTITNLGNMALDSSGIMIIAVAMTFVLIAGGIDLSVGSVAVLTSIIAAKAMAHFSGTAEQVAAYHYPHQAIGIPVGLLCGLAVAAACGLVNGFLIAWAKLPAFIITLGTSGIALGRLPPFLTTPRIP